MRALFPYTKWLRSQYLRLRSALTRKPTHSFNAIPFFQPSFMSYQVSLCAQQKVQCQWCEKQYPETPQHDFDLRFWERYRLGPSTVSKLLLGHYAYSAQVKCLYLVRQEYILICFMF